MTDDAGASAPEPRTERELVALLHPESALLFARARRALRDIAGPRADRFLVGRVEPGCWSVTRTRSRWLVVHDDGRVEFDSARSAVAYAMAGVMLDAGVGVNSELLAIAGIITWNRYGPGPRNWELGDTGREFAGRPAQTAASRPRFQQTCIRLSGVHGRPHDYFVCAMGAPPEDAAFVTAHEVFELAARHMLPDDIGVSQGEELPEGTVLDGYGGADDVFLFTPDTPFVRRGHWGARKTHTRRVYRLRRPLLAYPGLPVDAETFPGLDAPERAGADARGYYLVETVADLVSAGILADVSAGERGAGDG